MKTFSYVYQIGSFSRAADYLYLSQPTVSSHISFLEGELNQKLFDRLGRMVVPTQAGRLLYSHAKQIIQQVDQALVEVHGLQEKIAGDFLLGASTIPGHYLLPRVLEKYNQNYPQVSLYLHVADSYQIRKKVAVGELDMGIVGAYGHDPEIMFRPLLRDKLLVLGNRRFWSVEGDKTLQLWDLKSLPWIIREKGSGTRKALETGLKQLDLRLTDLNVVATVDSTLAVLKCIQAGLGVSITSQLVEEEVLGKTPDIMTKELGEEFERWFYLALHRERSLSPASQRFIQLLRHEVEPWEENTERN